MKTGKWQHYGSNMVITKFQNGSPPHAFNTQPNRSLKLQHAQRVVDPAEAAGVGAVGRVRCECIDGGDLGGRELEVEDGGVLGHARLVGVQ